MIDVKRNQVHRHASDSIIRQLGSSLVRHAGALAARIASFGVPKTLARNCCNMPSYALNCLSMSRAGPLQWPAFGFQSCLPFHRLRHHLFLDSVLQPVSLGVPSQPCSTEPEDPPLRPSFLFFYSFLVCASAHPHRNHERRRGYSGRRARISGR